MDQPSAQPSHDVPTVLVTGATGRLGGRLCRDLLSAGYKVRATTSRTPPNIAAIEWRSMNWLETLDFSSVVKGCAAIFHLGAELEDVSHMRRVNVEATRALAQAAERAGTRLMCHVSSASVYGSAKRRRVDEQAPLLTADRDVRSEFWVGAPLRAYARSKVESERAIASVARKVEYVIVRPTGVVSLEEIRHLGEWSWARRLLQGAFYTHHLYVGDFSHAMIWLLQRQLQREPRPGHVEIYNLSNDDLADNTHTDFFRRAHAETKDRRYVPLFAAPVFLETLRNMIQRGVPPGRHPFGAIQISQEKLYSEGYSHRFGAELAQQRAWRGECDD